MSADISTPTIRTLHLDSPLRPCAPERTAGTVGDPSATQDRQLDSLVDAVLRLLWQLVGAYVWLVLLAKRQRPVPARPAAARLVSAAERHDIPPATAGAGSGSGSANG